MQLISWPKDQLYNTNTSSYKYVWKGVPKKPLGRRLVRNLKCKDFLLTLPGFTSCLQIILAYHCIVAVFDVICVIKMWAPTGPP